MPTRNPRINVVLEKPIYDSICHLAHKERISLSLKVRDLIHDAMEIYEDKVLAKFAEERERSLDRNKSLTHEQIWKHLKK